jgi:hypothetical protein
MLGYESAGVNDQLVNVAPGQAYAPTTFGPAFTGPGFWPRNGVFNTPPVVPSPAVQSTMAPTQLGGGANYGGSIPMPTNDSGSGGKFSAFHMKHSPVIWALLFLISGVLLLKYVHYK